MKFLLLEKPKLLSLNAFSWNENSLCNQFQSSKDGSGFIAVWKKQIAPYLDKDTGKFGRSLSDESEELQVPPSPAITPERRAVKRSNSLTPTLMPSQKSPRLEPEEDSEDYMDKQIQENFIGRFGNL